MLHVARLTMDLNLDTDSGQAELILQGQVDTATDLHTIDRRINMPADMLYDRVQEHLNNALRLITNQLDQLRRSRQNLRR